MDEVATSQLAAILGIDPDLLRKWKARGLLKLAPKGVSGQGRGVECFWSNEAVEEAKSVCATRMKTRKRTRGRP